MVLRSDNGSGGVGGLDWNKNNVGTKIIVKRNTSLIISYNK